MGQHLYVMHKKDTKDGHMFKLMPTPVNALPHQYIKDLACVHRDLATLETGKGKGTEVEQVWFHAVCVGRV